MSDDTTRPEVGIAITTTNHPDGTRLEIAVTSDRDVELCERIARDIRLHVEGLLADAAGWRN
jgi:hypothetical protein